jgi:hypothetical protein
MRQEETGGDIGAIGIANCDRLVVTVVESILVGGVGDELSKSVSLQLEIFKVEDALSKASKEPGHAMFQNPSTRAKQCCSQDKLLAQRNQVVFIPASSVQQQ